MDDAALAKLEKLADMKSKGILVRVLGVTPRKGMRPLDGQRRPTSSHNRRRPTGCNHRHNALDAQAQASYVAGTCC